RIFKFSFAPLKACCDQRSLALYISFEACRNFCKKLFNDLRKKMRCTSKEANYSTVLSALKKNPFHPQPSRWLRVRQRTALPWIMQAPWH
ncbi:hypothetical protein, partial [Comamonas sp.]